ncbi:unnamed protein product [Rotaria magnacalcarata]|uniref:G-protein coupled receptors family 1 profile domain-containing protein n=1 Tax=Rotaria magnacalcarata TaxID=392030 RepID=A0A819CH56_9BILA|nr:unnamed protein product [Rotaria magnacalcarata]CAF2164072.1 unnamed protein product [Rotaria magnacalcarata]CAF3812354.1 unnamed protein product [Rotaria magnacalcarata]CAF3926695.1 unnamed protein product [Rotaria magnacalcarata]
MSGSQGSNNLSNSSFVGDSDILLPYVARFWILLPPEIASTLCTLIILFYIFTNRKARSNIKNHVLVLVLLLGLAIQLIDVPFYLNFIVHSAVIPTSSATCLIWNFVDVGLYNGSLILMVWMAFERHILVFHDQWLSTRKKRLLIHFVPLSSITLYIFIYYIYAYFLYPCENVYDYTSLYCGFTACYLNNTSLNWWDTLANIVIPSLLEPIFTFSFLFRIIWYKKRSRQALQWRKQRKMTIQLMGLSVPNFSLNFPLSVLYIAQICGVPSYFGANAVSYIYFLCYFITFIFSFVCLVSIIDVKKVFLTEVLRQQPQISARFTAAFKPQATGQLRPLRFLTS